MKFITAISMLALVFSATGCISTHLVRNKAQPHLEYQADEQQTRQVEGDSRYYALLPLTVIGDIATAPVQIIYFLVTDDSHHSTATIDGFPIPLP